MLEKKKKQLLLPINLTRVIRAFVNNLKSKFTSRSDYEMLKGNCKYILDSTSLN